VSLFRHLRSALEAQESYPLRASRSFNKPHTAPLNVERRTSRGLSQDVCHHDDRYGQLIALVIVIHSAGPTPLAAVLMPLVGIVSIVLGA
jgi:hypothetical protein